MTATRVKIDRSGRVVIPAELREELGLVDEVELVDTPDGLLLRSPIRPVLTVDEHGLRVVHVGRPVSVADVRRAVDEDRDARGRG